MSEIAAGKTSCRQIDESQPYPSRYFWLKRLSLGWLVLAILLAGLRGWWGYESQRRINALLTAAHARGEPILPEDFNSGSISSAENAATLYTQAGNSYAFAPGESQFEPDYPFSTSDVQFVSGLMSAHASEIKLMRSARDLHRADWGYRATYPYLNYSRQLNQGRRLGDLMKNVALCEHALGEDADAVPDLQSILALAHAQVTLQPTLVSLLVADGIKSMAVQAIINVSPTLEVGEHNKFSHGASEAQIKEMIQDLLDEKRMDRESQRNWLGERMLSIAAERQVVDAEIHPAAAADLLWPMFQLQSQRAALRHQVVWHASQMENFPAAMAALLPLEHMRGQPMLNMAIRREILGFMDPPRMMQIRYQNRTQCRVAAIMLAMRLYQSQHHGHLPAKLSELVPDYLPAVPLDPFSPVNAPLKYLPDRPAIYSVGTNGKDDGGSSRPVRSYLPSAYFWDQEDAVFPFGVATAPTQPAK